MDRHQEIYCRKRGISAPRTRQRSHSCRWRRSGGSDRRKRRLEVDQNGGIMGRKSQICILRNQSEFDKLFVKMGTPASKSSFKNNSISKEINFVSSSNSGKFTANIKSDGKENDVLTKFTWNYGGNTVKLSGSFTDWIRHITMEKHGEEFSITILLPRAIHTYKFIVDGEWRFSPEDPTTVDADGHINNYKDTTNYESIMNADGQETWMERREKQRDAIDESQERRMEPDENSDVPKLPQHYENCFYLAKRVFAEEKTPMSEPENQSVMEEANEKLKFESSLNREEIQSLFKTSHSLPMPTHITLDHLITHETEDYSAMTITQRCKEKYATYTYYHIRSQTA